MRTLRTAASLELSYFSTSTPRQKAT
uniref:Uncharacterized protein n=1 Tax=mine drainage metagenome TaxID=410659 RepID=E6QI85_9ZZZZ